jgi:tetratricopeptide (TPR) repeat protein
MRRHAYWVLGALVPLGVGLGLLGFYAWSQYHLRAARQALHRYDFRAASDHLQQSLSRWPGNSPALLLAAQTARRLDDCVLTERRLTDYERSYGPTEAAELEWLLLGAQQGDLAGHDGYLESLVHANHPNKPLILEALAKGYMNVARWNRMLSCLDLLLEREPTNTPAWILHGKGWDGLHNPERALDDFQRAVELDPASDEARLHLAETLRRLGRVREASAHYELVRQRQPDNPAALLGLAYCRFDSHELEKTAELLDALLAVKPDDVTALVERGRLALCCGEVAKAEEKLSRAAALAPWHREANRLLHCCLLTLGKTAGEEKCQDRLRQLQASDSQAGRLSLRYRSLPRDPSVRFELALWALQNGREQESRRWLFATLLVDPHHELTHAALADYFERAGQPRRSAEHRRRVQSRSVLRPASAIEW